jgi:hypothetical protein
MSGCFRRVRCPVVLAIAVAFSLPGDSHRAMADEPWSPLASYSDRIRPLLATRCYACHGGLKQEAGLRLDTATLMRKGGESGAALVPGDATASLIVARVRDPDPVTRMPPDGEGEPLTAEEIAVLEGWIRAGAPAPADEKPEADPRDHWAFRPRVRPAVPAVKNAAWVRNPIDAFLAHAHEQAGIAPQPEAPRHVLVRRLFIDLIGLPPQPEELAAIEADRSSDWYEKLVERLLADSRHGERWARHWMDVWRYADWWGLGEQHRNSQKHMWHFRDWIVESLNADVPYDEMVRQMLAADELYPEDQAKLRATGFLARNWFVFNRTPWLDDTVEHVGKGLLGLTLNCSKCHAHKYDPIQQEDYYRFRAFFEPIETRVDMVAGESDLEKDGIPRVFDAHLERPTYLFLRGEDTKPDTSRKIAPGVPEVLAFSEPAITSVSLPKAAHQPERQPWVLEAHLATAARAVVAAEAAVTRSADKRGAAAALVARFRRPAEPPSKPASTEAVATAHGGFADDFTTLDTARWVLLGGRWTHEPGRILQSQEGQIRGVARLRQTPVRDFDATVRFKILSGGYRSIGIGIDSPPADPAARPADGELLVYASGYAGGPKVQVAHAAGGAWQYPATAAVQRPVAVGMSHTLRVAIRDTLINVWFDGEPVLAWRAATPRRLGSLQLTTFDATAEITAAAVAPLAAGVPLQEPAAVVSAKPSDAPPVTPEAAVAAEQAAVKELAKAEAALRVERAMANSVHRRADAMRAAWEAEMAGSPEFVVRQHATAEAAVRAERELAVERSRQKLLDVEGRLAAAAPDAREKIEKELAAARSVVEKAEQTAAEKGENFTPLAGGRWTATRFKGSGADDPMVAFPATSSGRRTALARWITDPRNPLAARVAANQIWMRHLGTPLVTTVFEFGRKGNSPVHPGLLDWLASELVEGPRSPGAAEATGGWSMKHLHRLICCSAAYRMGSSLQAAEAAVTVDPDNRLLWRRTPTRLEAQVVRDAILSLAGTLDPAMGGPSVPPAAQGSSRRRSLYFWHSGISSNPFLATFDDAAPRECYQRDQSIVPQQALALANAAVVHEAAAQIADRIATQIGGAKSAPGGDAAFINRSFTTILDRLPTAEEQTACASALAKWRANAMAAPGGSDAARAYLVWALLNHNDFVTLR